MIPITLLYIAFVVYDVMMVGCYVGTDGTASQATNCQVYSQTLNELTDRNLAQMFHKYKEMTYNDDLLNDGSMGQYKDAPRASVTNKGGINRELVYRYVLNSHIASQEMENAINKDVQSYEKLRSKKETDEKREKTRDSDNQKKEISYKDVANKNLAITDLGYDQKIQLLADTQNRLAELRLQLAAARADLEESKRVAYNAARVAKDAIEEYAVCREKRSAAKTEAHQSLRDESHIHAEP